MVPVLDLEFVRQNFQAFTSEQYPSDTFFENAGGSYACKQVVDKLTYCYNNTKVQPYGFYKASKTLGEMMDHSRQRWAQALGVQTDQILFGPSTSMNTYVIAQAFAQTFIPGDEVIITNQDHEANSGAIRRAAEAQSCSVRVWQVNPETGLLDIADLVELINDRTKVLCFAHCSNIIGVENDVKAITALARAAGVRTVVDGVSFAPHGFSNIRELGADIYLFSLYKTYSVHQGLIVAQNNVLDDIPHQGHWFNSKFDAKHLTPAGPDHVQEAASCAVLDYVEASAKHHEISFDSLASAVKQTNEQWQRQESAQLTQVAQAIEANGRIHPIGPLSHPTGLHRCPTVAFVVENRKSAEVAAEMVSKGIQCGAGHFYAKNLLNAVRVNGEQIDSDDGVVRTSWVHYTSQSDIDRLCEVLEQL